MTLSELATTPEIVLGIMSLMLVALTAIAGMIWRLCKVVIPVFLSFRTDFESQKATCNGQFDLVRLRIDENDEKIDELGERVGVIEIDLKKKKEIQNGM